MGYHQAGFDEIVGVDIKPQPRYPFEFVQADALEYVAEHGSEFDVIHASPPCQAYSVTVSLSNGNHPMLVIPLQRLLKHIGKPYVIENVPGAPLENPLMLCGTMFGLKVIRHRLFEIWPETIWFPPSSCHHIGKTAPIWWQDIVRCGYKVGTSMLDKFNYITVSGKNFLLEDGQRAMGIDWMTIKELSQAIPPAYTCWIGRQILERQEVEG